MVYGYINIMSFVDLANFRLENADFHALLLYDVRKALRPIDKLLKRVEMGGVA